MRMHTPQLKCEILAVWERVCHFTFSSYRLDSLLMLVLLNRKNTCLEQTSLQAQLFFSLAFRLSSHHLP